MSFSKRSIPLSKTPRTTNAETSEAPPTPGIRPSPVTGQPTTSTGCASLDSLLAANAGLVLGNSILIEETGTTDYASALLRCSAAEAVLQHHQVHVVGVGEAWGRDLPGTVENRTPTRVEKSNDANTLDAESERMKIAWRYERLGAHGEPAPSVAVPRGPGPPTAPGDGAQTVFCHTFDLTKRLVPPSTSHKINYIALGRRLDQSPYEPVIRAIRKSTSGANGPLTIHRIIIPSLLSPALYPTHASQPAHLLCFLHSLRALLRQHPSNLSALLSLPLSLYPRSAGLVRWMEHLVDGVIELAPFPHTFDSSSAAGPGGKEEEKPQGLVRVYSLPVFSERGGGGGMGVGSAGDDLCFLVSRRKFLIRPFNLPPVEGDTEAQTGGGASEKANMEF